MIELQKGFAFAVTVRNSGCVPVNDARVRLALSAGEPEFAGEAQIDELNPGDEATVDIGHLPLPPIHERLVLRVEVEPIPGEGNVDNNAADYPVRFALVE